MFENVKEYLAKDHIIEAITSLREIMKDHKEANKLIQFSGRYHDLKNHILIDTLSYDEITRNKNKIRHSLLEFIAEIEKDNQTLNELKQKSFPKHLVNTVLIGFPILLCFFIWIVQFHNSEPKYLKEGYKVFQSISLNEKYNGLNGKINLCIDKSLSGFEAELIKDPYGPEEYLYITSDYDEDMHDTLLKHALLIISDENENVIYEEQLGTTLARLDRTFLYLDKSKPTFIVTRDYSVGMGSYNGPISYFFEVEDGKIQYIIENGLMLSLKNSWIIYNSTNRIGATRGKDILSVSCFPEEINKFVVHYTRYFFEGSTWRRLSKKEVGYWEEWKDDLSNFPKIENFP